MTFAVRCGVLPSGFAAMTSVVRGSVLPGGFAAMMFVVRSGVLGVRGEMPRLH
jgi:hypothetical protein